MVNPQPPKWANRFLAWFCRPELLEDLEGDLYELFEARLATRGPSQARWFFVWWVLRSLRWDVVRRPKPVKNSSFIMTRNNVKIAVRVLKRDRLNTALSLGGLTIGIACFLLMGFFVKQELSYDHFHEKKDRLYRVWVKEDYGSGKVFFNSITPYPFEAFLEDNFPEVETSVQIAQASYLVGTGQDRTNESVSTVSPEFFQVFDFPIVMGEPNNPLSDLNQLVLSESYAKKYFGEANPIGQFLAIQLGEEQQQFRVAAVFQDMPLESSIQFDMAISNANNERLVGPRILDAWFNVATETYVLLSEQAQLASLEEKVPAAVMEVLAEEVNEGEYNLGFQPLTDIHLNADIPVGFAPVGNKSYVFILGAISLLVLIIASINYTTLTVGASLRRSKEVGIRKVMGAFQGSLIQQYLTESVLIAFISTVLGVGLAYLLTPTFNDLTQAQVSLVFEPWHVLLFLGIVLVVGISSGMYPAFVLAKQRITSILKGHSQPKRNHTVRKSLMVFQYVVTVFLITSTLVMQRQLQYLHNKDLGYTYDATVSVPLYPSPFARNFLAAVSTAMEKGDLLRNQLMSYPEVQDVGLGSHVVGTNGWGQLAFTDKEGAFRQFRILLADPQYFDTFQLTMAEGRVFDPNNEADTRQGIIVNEAAVRYFGWEEPIGASLPGADFIDHTVIGVVEDFHFASLHSEIEPLVIARNMEIPFSGISDTGFNDSPIPKLVFRYTGNQLSNVKHVLDAEWAKAFPEEDLNFSFVEENIGQQYASDERMNRLVMVATILSIIIASLGLLGLTVLVINSRIKEIGIRKVIGASEGAIFGLLARSFSWQLVLGILLSIPITLWLMQDWLSEFAYRISMGVDIFVLSSIISLAVALIVISYHTWRAAKVNPVKSLRSE